MLLDQTLDILTKSAWALFGIGLIFAFGRTLYYEGFDPALRVIGDRRTLISFLLVMSLSILSLALVFIEPQQVGVVVSIVSPDGIREQPERSGLRWIVPFAEQIYLYPIYWQTYTMSGKPLEGEVVGDDAIAARTFDGQEVLIDCTVIFRLETEQAVRIHIDWQRRYIEDFIRPYVRGIVRTEVSQFTIDEVNSFKRRDLELRLDELLRRELASKGFVLDKFVLRNIGFTTVYADAVEQKQVALQEITKAEHMAEQVRQMARGEADKQVIAANAEATAIAVVARAEAEALRRIAESVTNQPDLLTYNYINKISPNLRVMLLPSENPFILSLPTMEDMEQMENLAGTPDGQNLEELVPPLNLTPTPTPNPDGLLDFQE